MTIESASFIVKKMRFYMHGDKDLSIYRGVSLYESSNIWYNGGSVKTLPFMLHAFACMEQNDH